MALKGNLRDFTITQLLNLVNLARKTGTLVLEGPNGVAQMVFREGKLAYAQAGQQDNSLVSVLYQTNRITARQQRIIRANAGDMPDKELGLLLINANYLSQQDILSSLQHHYSEVVKDILTWADGFFRFENGLAAPAGKIAVRVSLENLIIEGTRRFHERQQLQDEIPSLDMALKFTERPGTNLRKVNLNADEWRVVSFVNPKNTLRQIGRATKMSDFEIRRIVYGLLQAGLVEIVRPEGAPQPAEKPGRLPVSTIAGSKEERRSLINRIITRIRSL